MTWIPLLLGDKSPALRYLVMKELLHKSENDRELRELFKLRFEDPILTGLLDFQNNDGSWGSSEELGLLLHGKIGNTAQALCRLGYLGFNESFKPIKKAAEFLFSHQMPNGSWPHSPTSETFKHSQHGEIIAPIITALPLRGLAMCGFATDPRSEKAYDYLLSIRAEDGSWPIWLSPDGKIGYQPVGYRQMPNSRLGCRSNSTSALSAFAYHPERRTSPEAQRVLDLLLARETRERQVLGFEVARYIGIEPARGRLTYYARFDLTLILNLCWRLGANTSDPRVEGIVNFLRESQGSYGLWEYQLKPEASRWVTFDILRSLMKIDETSEWISTEPRTKYKSYPRKPARY